MQTETYWFAAILGRVVCALISYAWARYRDRTEGRAMLHAFWSFVFGLLAVLVSGVILMASKPPKEVAREA